MLGLLKRHAVEVLLKAGHKRTDLGRLTESRQAPSCASQGRRQSFACGLIESLGSPACSGPYYLHSVRGSSTQTRKHINSALEVVSRNSGLLLPSLWLS